MILKTPNNCGECFFVKRMFDILVCTNPGIPKEWDVQDIRSFKVDSSEIPEWCPYILTNRRFKELSQEKQKAVLDIMSGMRGLLGWNEVSADGN